MNAEIGYCYVVLFSNGFVKGGKSRDIFKRYEGYHATEKALLSDLSILSEERIGEFFRGINEDLAIESIKATGFRINSIEECTFGIPKYFFEKLARCSDLTGEILNIALYMLSELSFDRDSYVVQTEIATSLGMHKQSVSRAISVLEEKGILIRGPKLARSSSFRLNPNFGYKGNPSGKVYRTRDGRREFRVVDDEGYVVPPNSPEAKETPDKEPA